MAAVVGEPVFTLEDLLALPDDGHRHELIWGRIVMAPVESSRHADVVDALAAVLRSACPSDLWVRTRAGVIAPGRPVINTLGPDISVCRRGAPSDPYVDAAEVRLVVEVSLSTQLRDLTDKAAAYADGGIEWYWVVHPELSGTAMRLPAASALAASPGDDVYPGTSRLRASIARRVTGMTTRPSIPVKSSGLRASWATIVYADTSRPEAIRTR